MENSIHLEKLTQNRKKLEDALTEGKLIAARSKNDFLYVLAGDNEYYLFSHTAGQADAGRKLLPKDSQNATAIRQLAKIADAVFAVEFDKEMDIPSVLYSTEEAILSAFPIVDDGNRIDFSNMPKADESAREPEAQN